MKPRPTRRLTDTQQALAADPEALKLAESIARRVAKKCPGQRDEIYSAGLYGLVEAARAFDPDRGFKFTSFAERRIWGAIIDWMRSEEPAGYRRTSMSRRPGMVKPKVYPMSQGHQDHDAFGFAESIADPGPPPEARAANMDSIHKLLSGLPPQHRNVVRLYYLDSSTPTLRLVGLRLGLSESRCSQVMTEAANWLRERAEDRQLRETEAA